MEDAIPAISYLDYLQFSQDYIHFGLLAFHMKEVFGVQIGDISA